MSNSTQSTLVKYVHSLPESARAVISKYHEGGQKAPSFDQFLADQTLEADTTIPLSQYMRIGEYLLVQLATCIESSKVSDTEEARTNYEAAVDSYRRISKIATSMRERLEPLLVLARSQNTVPSGIWESANPDELGSMWSEFQADANKLNTARKAMDPKGTIQGILRGKSVSANPTAGGSSGNDRSGMKGPPSYNAVVEASEKYVLGPAFGLH
jgi:hypothetical protein